MLFLNQMKVIQVSAAVIFYNSQVLCVQRPKNKFTYISEKFEFPGGKIDVGETSEEALIRELKEELSLEAEIGNHLITVNHTYPDFELIMHVYRVKVSTREIQLNEHISSKWLRKEELGSLDWAAADIPVVEQLLKVEW